MILRAGSVFHEGDTPELFIVIRLHRRALTRGSINQLQVDFKLIVSGKSKIDFLTFLGLTKVLLFAPAIGKSRAKATSMAKSKREVSESSFDFLHYSIVDTFSR